MTVLTIRDAQMAALRAAMLQQFAQENARRVRPRFPEAAGAKSENAVAEWVLRITQRARAHGVTRRRDIELFIDFEFVYGPEFERHHSAAGRILARTEIGGTRKMALIEDWELFARPERSRW